MSSDQSARGHEAVNVQWDPHAFALHGAICPNGHWTLGSVEPGLRCGTCGGPYGPLILVPREQVDELRLARRVERSRALVADDMIDQDRCDSVDLIEVDVTDGGWFYRLHTLETLSQRGGFPSRAAAWAAAVDRVALDETQRQSQDKPTMHTLKHTPRCARDSDWCDGVICRERGIDCPYSDAPREIQPRTEG